MTAPATLPTPNVLALEHDAPSLAVVEPSAAPAARRLAFSGVLMRAQKVGLLLTAAAAGTECVLAGATAYDPSFKVAFGVLVLSCVCGLTGQLLAPRPTPAP